MTPVYKVAGYPCGMSLDYLQSLRDAGWSDEHVALLSKAIPLFEASCSTLSFDESCNTLYPRVNELHIPFLKELHLYMTHLLISAKGEAIQTIAQDPDHKLVLAANAVLKSGTNEVKEVGLARQFKELSKCLPN